MDNLTFLFNPWRFVLETKMRATEVVKSQNQNNKFQLINYNWKHKNVCHSYVKQYKHKQWFYGQDVSRN